MRKRDCLNELLGWIHLRPKSKIERIPDSAPPVRKPTEQEYAMILLGLEASLQSHASQFSVYSQLPAVGRGREEIIKDMEAMKAFEESRWKDGFVSGAVYHGDSAHVDFLNRVYALNSQSNPLHADVWPSTIKFEAEVVAMTAHMLGAGDIQDGSKDEICGVVSSGGTESILLAMKAYRDWAKDKKGITEPEMVVPSTAHAAFNKAAEYFGIKIIRVPVSTDYRADVAATRKAITENTVVIVGSSPSFPHGVIDPIRELSELAREKGIGFHTDACLGGFFLPWAEKLGYPIPPFDFRLPGVTSISADTHKYGYAAKGTSVILYRTPELRRYQYYAIADWPGGLYFSPTLAGSRPGALSAVCWAAMVSMGEEGYMDAAKKILKTAAFVRKGIEAIPDIRILGNPLWVIAFASDTVNIYKVMDCMAKKGWNLNGLHNPPAVHICITLRHTEPGVAQRFIADLKSAVEYVKENPNTGGGMAPIYGMAAAFPLKGVVTDLLKRYVDLLYKVKR